MGMLQRASQATVVNLTGDKKALDAAQGQLGSFCSQLFGEGTSSSTPDWSSLASLVSVKPNEAFSVPTQVNYVAKGGSLYKPGEVTSGPIVSCGASCPSTTSGTRCACRAAPTGRRRRRTPFLVASCSLLTGTLISRRRWIRMMVPLRI